MKKVISTINITGFERSETGFRRTMESTRTLGDRIKLAKVPDSFFVSFDFGISSMTVCLTHLVLHLGKEINVTL